MVNTGSDRKGQSRHSDRDLLLGRVGKPGSSNKPVAPLQKGTVPSGQADNALLREILQRITELSERIATTEQNIHITKESLERISSAIDEFVRLSGERSHDPANATAALPGILERLQGIEEKVPNTTVVTETIRQDHARLADRIGVLSRTIDVRLPGEDGRNSDVADQVRLLGKMLTVRMDEVGRNLDGIRTEIGSADPVVSTQKRISRQDEELPSPVPAIAVPDLADPDAMERAVGVLGDLHSRIGIGLFVLEQALPQADRKRAIADFRRKQDAGPRRRWLRQFLAVAALVIATAWIEATWYPFGRLFAWTRYLTGWPL